MATINELKAQEKEPLPTEQIIVHEGRLLEYIGRLGVVFGGGWLSNDVATLVWQGKAHPLFLLILVALFGVFIIALNSESEAG